MSTGIGNFESFKRCEKISFQISEKKKAYRLAGIVLYQFVIIFALSKNSTRLLINTKSI